MVVNQHINKDPRELSDRVWQENLNKIGSLEDLRLQKLVSQRLRRTPRLHKWRTATLRWGLRSYLKTSTICDLHTRFQTNPNNYHGKLKEICNFEHFSMLLVSRDEFLSQFIQLTTYSVLRNPNTLQRTCKFCESTISIVAIYLYSFSRLVLA